PPSLHDALPILADEVTLDLFRIHEMRHAELTAERLTLRIDVNADNHVGTHHARALNDVEANAAKTEHHNICARLDACRENDSTNARRHAATNVANLVKGRVLAHLGKRNLGQHRVIGEGGAAHIV